MISWKSKKQNSVALSTCEVEFITISLANQEALYLRALLKTMTELESLKHLTTIHCDNKSNIVLVKNPVVHQRSNYIDIKFQFIRDEINKGSILLEYIETEKCRQCVNEANNRNKIEHFQKGYCRQLCLSKLGIISPVNWDSRIH